MNEQININKIISLIQNNKTFEAKIACQKKEGHLSKLMKQGKAF